MPIERCQRKLRWTAELTRGWRGFSFQSCPSIYRGDAHAIADGKKLCTSVGKDVVYKQVLTDPGMFAIIYNGASDAMQSFHRRGMKQDEMLRIIACVRTLDK